MRSIALSALCGGVKAERPAAFRAYLAFNAYICDACAHCCLRIKIPAENIVLWRQGKV